MGAPATVVDLRLYRIAFLPTLAAVVALLFSLQSAPGPLHPLVAPTGFERSAATRYAQQIVARAPDRSPGSPGDAAAAAMVVRTFKTVAAGHLAIQRFGNDGSLSNVILKLPGQSHDQLVLLAPRDTASPPGAASSAAATGALEELASALGTVQHTKTIILVSTDGGSSGAAGARVLADDYLDPSRVDGIVALEQPGVATPHQPYLLDTSTGADSTSIQLVRTAELSLAEQAGLHTAEPGPFGQIAELALPGGLGEQAVLIARGYDAVGLSSAGERPLPPSEDQLADLSGKTLDRFARTAMGLVLALDSTPGQPIHGPGAYIEVGGNLVPGWALGVLAFTLLLPALVAAVDALARAGRRHVARAAIAWAAIRSLPLVVALAALYAMALIGIVPRPSFPFDPGTFALGPAEVLAMLALVLVAGAVWWRLGRNRMAVRMAPESAAAALGLLCGLALVVILVVNPYLALLLVPLAHPWLIEARAGRHPDRWRCTSLVMIALLPLLLGAVSVAGRLDLGAGSIWPVTLAFGDFGIRIPIAIAGCVLAGSLASLIVLAGAGAEAGPPGPARPPRPRNAETPAQSGDAAGEEAWTDSRLGSQSQQPMYEPERDDRLYQR
jgi:hypothetical protein